jgi:hypothetical protein
MAAGAETISEPDIHSPNTHYHPNLLSLIALSVPTLFPISSL